MTEVLYLSRIIVALAMLDVPELATLEIAPGSLLPSRTPVVSSIVSTD
jgi:hypothetical protein